jgi:ABC-2 type transport system ATP-binding protein
MEIRLGQPAAGVPQHIADLVQIEEQGPDWLRYSTSDPDTINPIVIRTLGRHDVRIVTLSGVPRSLEEVYLSAVHHTGQGETRVVDGKVVSES